MAAFVDRPITGKTLAKVGVEAFLIAACPAAAVSRFHMGIPVWKGGGRQNILHLGTPRNHKVFVPIWGLPNIYVSSQLDLFNLSTVSLDQF